MIALKKYALVTNEIQINLNNFFFRPQYVTVGLVRIRVGVLNGQS